MMEYATKVDSFLRQNDVRLGYLCVTLTLLSLAMIGARISQDADLTVTFQLAGLASMVAMSVPLTYIPLVQVHTNIRLQRDGKLRSATVTDHLVNPAGFARWLLEIKTPDGIVRKWVQSTSKKLALGADVDVTLSADLVHCRVETPGRSIWKTTVYFTTLLLISIADTIESMYCLIFGLGKAASLLREEGCSVLNILLHILFAFIFGGAVLGNAYVLFWRRRYAGLPSIYTFERLSEEDLAGEVGEYRALIA